MKKLVCICFVLLLLPLMALRANALSPGDLTAEAAVLIDADTGQVLFEKNMSRRMYPASTTKIMTGLLAMEQLQDDDVLTISQQVVNDVPRNTSHIALTSGEQISVKNAMYAMMLPSANDAADALAERIAGSFDDFALLMNQRAKQLGALDTSFVNAHGLHNPNHYTTAYDLALITREAACNQRFMRFFGTPRYTVPATNLQPDERPLTNQQWMLLEDMWVYSPEVIGGKVGFTDEARYTMSTVGQKNGRTLVCVVMKSGHDERFYDTQMLLDFGFDEFVSHTLPADSLSAGPVPVLEEREPRGSATLYAGGDVAVLLHKSMDPGAVELVPQHPENYELGEQAQGEMLVRIPVREGDGLYAVLARVPLSAELTLSDTAPPDEADSRYFTLPGLLRIVFWVAGILALLFLLLLLLLVLERHRVMKRRKRRRLQAYKRRRRG